MNRLFRHTLIAPASALIALMALLFLASATMAVAAPMSAPGMAPLGQSRDMPCEKGKPACASDCAVLCYGLLVEPPVVAPPITHPRQIYRPQAITLRSLSVEAEDPPPR